jgi:intein/homing endonuclease
MYFNPIVMRIMLEKIPHIETDFSRFLSYTSWNKMFLNGNWFAIVRDISETVMYLRHLKYEQKLIPYHVSFSVIDNELHVFCDEGRLIRPFFSVDRMPPLHGDWKEWDVMVRQGQIVWMDVHELEDKVVAMFPWEITPTTDLCEIHPCLMLGVCASMMPYADHTQSPRICYHASMVKQSIGIYSGTNEIRADTISHILCYPERPVVRSHVEDWMRLDTMPCGNNVVVAIACYGGWNQEDSIILNRGSVDKGLFRSFTYKTIMVEEKKKTSSQFETIDIVPLEMRIRSFNYSKLDGQGIVKKGVFVGSGDVIVSKISIRQVKTGREEKMDTSMVIKNGEEGYVDKVFITTTPDGYKMVKIKIRCLKIPEIGDKLCSNCAQKGTIGMILSQEDMPFTPDGIVPDIIINPLCFPADTWVRCHNGLARTIKDILWYTVDVDTFSIEEKGFIKGTSMGGEFKGMMRIVRLMREDGKMIRCTPDHRFLLYDGRTRCFGWKKASDIDIKRDEIVMGAYTPRDVPDEIFQDFHLQISNNEFYSMTTDREFLMTFFRLAGYYHVDGCDDSYDRRLLDDTTVLMAHKVSICNLFETISDETIPLPLVREYMAGYLGANSDMGKNGKEWLIRGKDMKFLHTLAIILVKRFDLVCHLVEDRMCLKIPDIAQLVHKIGIRYHRMKEMQMTVMAAYQEYDGVAMRFDEYLRYCRADIWFYKETMDGYCPFWTCRVRERVEEEGRQPVYCIGVRRTHCFVAESMVAENCIPSRMTINQLMESIGAKSAVMQGRFRDATTFSSHSVNIVDRLKTELQKAGFERNGNEVLINGITGKMMEADIFIGLNYYHRLKHLVSAKIHARNHGKVSQLTQQPLEGRSRDGGLRFGEMERDCGSGELDISLYCGLSVKLKAMEKISYNVFGWDEKRMGMTPSNKIGFVKKGVRECVDIMLQDGRTIRCTPDHPFLTTNNTWVPAQDLMQKPLRLRTSLCFPCIDIATELVECDKWSFFLDGIDLRTDTIDHYFRTMAFMRVLGWIVTDGGIYRHEDGHMRGQISLGYEMDVKSFLQDLRHFCHDSKYNDPASRFMKICVSSTSGQEWSHYSIPLPHYFTQIISQIDSITIGKKICQEACLPAFVMAENFPRPLLREFLGGMFGGDGHTCILSMHRGKRDVLTSVSFSKSRTKPYVESLVQMMEDMKILLARCGIHNVTIQNLKETSHSKQKTVKEDEKCYQSTLHLDISELIPFWEKIGFRHCVHKSLRLEAGVSYKRLRETVIRQHNWLVQRVDEITGFSEIKKQFPNKIVGTKKAIEKAVQELSARETLVHPYAIPTTHDITDHLIKGTSFGKFTSKSFPNAEEFMKDIGAYHWFVEQDESKNVSGYTCFAIKTEDDVLPTMEMTVVGVRPCGPEEVYDIEVDETNSFLANGVVAHNCMISHGNSRFLLERLFDMSDPFKIPVCSKCGNMPSTTTYCSVCDETNIVTVPMPYACKLLFQELNAMGIRINLHPEKD